MTQRSALRTLFIIGLAALASGSYIARWQRPASDFGQVGVIAILAVGIFAAIVGLVGLLREQPPVDTFRATRARILDVGAWKALIAPVVGGGLMFAFFGLTDRWNELSNPVASQVALLAGILGALVAIVADRITRWWLALLPAVILIALVGWGNRIPLESETTSRGEMVALLTIVVLLVGIGINIPQILRGRRRADA